MEAGPVDLGVRDHPDGHALRTRQYRAIELLPLVRVQLLRVVQIGERPDAMVAKSGVVEQHARNDERSCERSPARLVRSRHPAGAEAPVEPKKPLPRPLPRPPARRLSTRRRPRARRCRTRRHRARQRLLPLLRARGLPLLRALRLSSAAGSTSSSSSSTTASGAPSEDTWPPYCLARTRAFFPTFLRK